MRESSLQLIQVLWYVILLLGNLILIGPFGLKDEGSLIFRNVGN
jgi:hypothetical protein